MKIISYYKTVKELRFTSLRFLFIWILGPVLGVTSCKKFVQIPPPETKLVTPTVFNNSATATAAQFYIYTTMQANQSFSIEQATGTQSDELTNYSTSQTLVQLYNNNLLASTPASGGYGPWLTGYSLIYDANAVIAGLQQNVGVSQAVKQQLTGEALFIRALWYFNLTNYYGDIPLPLTPDYTINDHLSRTTRVQVLQQIISDLKNAETMLNSNYVDASDTLVTTERVRPTKAAAGALMARTFLYLGDFDNHNIVDYQNAEGAATTVINNTLYSLPPLTNVFLKNSFEAIWQLQTPTTATTDTPDGGDFILTGAPSTGSLRCDAISPQLLSSFEAGDLRKTNWLGSYSSGSNIWYFPYKYKNRTYAKQEYVMVLRLGEQYLIRAEARAEEGNTTGALADLNIIRNRAGLSNYAGATDKASLLTAILHERQVELFCEWGHRWFDLNRTGNTNAVMSVVTPLKHGIWNNNGYQMLYPIPQSEILLNSNLTQNPGY